MRLCERYAEACPPHARACSRHRASRSRQTLAARPPGSSSGAACSHAQTLTRLQSQVFEGKVHKAAQTIVPCAACWHWLSGSCRFARPRLGATAPQAAQKAAPRAQTRRYRRRRARCPRSRFVQAERQLRLAT
eukprot:4792768-Pleurochrysis_carterae.AAC.2